MVLYFLGPTGIRYQNKNDGIWVAIETTTIQRIFHWFDHLFPCCVRWIMERSWQVGQFKASELIWYVASQLKCWSSRWIASNVAGYQEMVSDGIHGMIHSPSQQKTDTSWHECQTKSEPIFVLVSNFFLKRQYLHQSVVVTKKTKHNFPNFKRKTSNHQFLLWKNTMQKLPNLLRFLPRPPRALGLLPPASCCFGVGR